MNTNKLKKGDKLKCIDTFIGMTQIVYYEKDKLYNISEIRNGTFEISSKYGLPIYFNTSEHSAYNINKFFTNIKEERTEKLLKITQHDEDRHTL